MAATLEPGTKAPAFTLSDSKGKTHKLSDYSGKDVVLYFYPKDNTPGCTKQACGFRDLWSDYKKNKIVVLGVSPDESESHKKFISEYDLPFTLLCDPNKKVMEKYQAWGEKVLYGKKMVGVIRTTLWIGPDGKIKKRWKKVPKAADNPQRVLETILSERD